MGMAQKLLAQTKFQGHLIFCPLETQISMFCLKLSVSPFTMLYSFLFSRVIPQITTLLVQGFLFNSNCNRLSCYEVSQIPLFSAVQVYYNVLELTSNRI